MNKKIVLELPEGVMCCFVNYVFSTPSGLSMGTTTVDGDDLFNGKKICMGADGYEESED